MTIDQQAIEAYARITGDSNPIHLDPEFAATTPMGGIIAHGTISLGLMLQMITLSLGADRSSIRISVRFLSPVRPGDRITAGGRSDEAYAGRHQVWVKNQKGEVVISGHAEIDSLPTHHLDRQR
jgi:acyl dehydratase